MPPFPASREGRENRGHSRRKAPLPGGRRHHARQRAERRRAMKEGSAVPSVGTRRLPWCRRCHGAFQAVVPALRSRAQRPAAHAIVVLPCARARKESGSEGTMEQAVQQKGGRR